MFEMRNRRRFGRRGAARNPRCTPWVAIFAGVLLTAVVPAQAARETTLTIANYPVEATAANAVEAKQKAIAEGQAAALRSLLRRLAPVTRTHEIRKLTLPDAASLVASMRVRSERNSRTRYEAELDITFDRTRVLAILATAGIPAVVEQAEPVVLVPIYRPPPGSGVPRTLTAQAASALWAGSWSGLDVLYSPAPLKIEALKPQIHADTIAMVETGSGGERILAGEYDGRRVVLAILEPDLATRRLRVTLAGSDAVGPLKLQRSYRFDPADAAYAFELAAVISQGVLEGRWKAIRSAAQASLASSPASGPVVGPLPLGIDDAGQDGRLPRESSAESGGPLPIRVRFDSLAQWQQMRDAIEAVPGVEVVEVMALSRQGADIVVRYQSGGARLADELSMRGLQLQPYGATWLLQ